MDISSSVPKLELFLHFIAIGRTVRSIFKGHKLTLQIFFMPIIALGLVLMWFWGILSFKGLLNFKKSCLNFLVSMPVSDYLGLFHAFLCTFRLTVLKCISYLAIKLLKMRHEGV